MFHTYCQKGKTVSTWGKLLHNSLAGHHTGGKPALNPPSPPPADGEGPDVEPGPWAHRRQGTAAEDADAGREPQQGSCVDGDAQTRSVFVVCHAESAQVVIAPSIERMAPVT